MIRGAAAYAPLFVVAAAGAALVSSSERCAGLLFFVERAFSRVTCGALVPSLCSFSFNCDCDARVL